jgi:hypothetical protein
MSRVSSLRGRPSPDAQTPRGSTAPIDGSDTRDIEGTPDPAGASAQPLSSVTTRSGRVVGKLVPTNPVVKKERGAEVASNFERVILRSARYQAVLAESTAAKTREELAAAEMKLWNLRHRYAPEGSNSPHSVNLQRLLKLAEQKLGREERDMRSNPRENQEMAAVSGDETADPQESAGPGFNGAEAQLDVMGTNLLGIKPFNEP